MHVEYDQDWQWPHTKAKHNSRSKRVVLFVTQRMIEHTSTHTRSRTLLHRQTQQPKPANERERFNKR